MNFEARTDASSSSTDDALTSELIAWYPMDALEPMRLRDTSGNGRDLTCTPGLCPTLMASTRGDVVHFNGTDVMTSGPASWGDVAELTVSVWIQPGAAGGTRCPLNKRLGTGILNSWQICSNASLQVSFHSDTQSGTHTLRTGVPELAVGTWTHVALRWSAATQLKELFIDGALNNSAVAPLQWDTAPFLLGADMDNGAPLAFFAGELDDVRIYRRTLGDAEITALAKQ